MNEKNYNTQRQDLILKEYGRNVQMLAGYLLEVEEKQQRTEMAHALVELMRQLNPSTKDYQDNQQKIWDDLYIITDFKLDVDSPYPKPEEDVLVKKPEKVDYRDGEVTFRHYGRNVELLVERAKQIEDKKEREAAIILVGKLMKTFSGSFGKESVEDAVILKNIERLSKGELTLEVENPGENNLFDIYNPAPQTKTSNKPSPKKKSSRRKRN